MISMSEVAPLRMRLAPAHLGCCMQAQPPCDGCTVHHSRVRSCVCAQCRWHLLRRALACICSREHPSLEVLPTTSRLDVNPCPSQSVCYRHLLATTRSAAACTIASAPSVALWPASVRDCVKPREIADVTPRQGLVLESDRRDRSQAPPPKAGIGRRQSPSDTLCCTRQHGGGSARGSEGPCHFRVVFLG